MPSILVTFSFHLFHHGFFIVRSLPRLVSRLPSLLGLNKAANIRYHHVITTPVLKFRQ